MAVRALETFSFSSIGDKPPVGHNRRHLSSPSLNSSHEVPAEGSPAVHWGDCLRPHHFDFAEGTAVRLRITSHPFLILHAVSVIGAGQFKEFDNSTPVAFEKGGIIVKGSDRVKFFTFETFQKHFVLEDGETIDSIFQVNYQTPMK